MNKNELEFKKLQLKSEQWTRIFSLIAQLATLATILGCVYLVIEGLVKFVGHKPEAINALAGVIEKLNLGSLLSYVVAAGTTAGYLIERSGKKRAYKELGEKRAEIAKDDPHNASSNLTPQGHTPQ